MSLPALADRPHHATPEQYEADRQMARRALAKIRGTAPTGSPALPGRVPLPVLDRPRFFSGDALFGATNLDRLADWS